MDALASSASSSAARTTLMANAIRALAMDAVQQANSGHPGMPMGMADIAVALWSGTCSHNPANPRWADRDRFVLSNGHGSMLLYALLHLTGYDLPIDELKNFRQLHSQDAGPSRSAASRPASRPRPGRSARASPTPSAWRSPRSCWPREFNRPGYDDRRSPHLCVHGRRLPDGRHLARGLLARRHAGLGKLIALYDDNGISIDGKVDGWFTDDTPKRFEAYGWNVIARRRRPRRRCGRRARSRPRRSARQARR